MTDNAQRVRRLVTGWAAPAGLLLAGGLAVAACGWGGGSPSAAGASDPPGASTTTTSTTEAPEPTTTEPLEAACTTGELQIEGVSPTNSDGSVYLEVVVGTRGGVRCSVDGNPSLAFYGQSGSQLVTLPEKSEHEAVNGSAPMGSAAERIDIGPQSGDTASFFVEVPQKAAGGGGCQAAYGLRFAAPGSATWSGRESFAATVTGPTGTTTSINACEPAVFVSVFEPPILPDISG